MFSQNKNYLSKFLQLTGIFSVFLLIFFSHNKVFGAGENTPPIKEQISTIKNKDQQKADIKTKAEALLQEISNFETKIKTIFTTANIEELKQIFDDAAWNSLSTEITNKLAIKTILPADKTILENMQQLVQKIKEQKQAYSNDVLILSKAGEKSLEEVKTAFLKIMDQTKLLETNMKNLETENPKLTANKLNDTIINNLKNKINDFLTKSHSSELEAVKTQLTKIETDYQKLKESETAPNSDQKVAEASKTATETTKSTTKAGDKDKGINTFQIIIIGVFIAIMISVIIVWILQQIKKPQSKR